MNKENTNLLFEKYPNLFPNGSKVNPMESLMVYGFECGDGWINLIDKLCSDITNLKTECMVVQVKEKFGGLRFYTEGTSNEVFDLIRKAEEDSFNICEICGESGKLIDFHGWMMVRCNAHKNQRNKHENKN